MNLLRSSLTSEWTLEDAIDALMAYDLGATDSGVKDDTLKSLARDVLNRLTRVQARALVVEYVKRHYRSPQGRMQGYTAEDVQALCRWLSHEMGANL